MRAFLFNLMSNNKKYQISLSALKAGTNEFEFDVNDKLFENYKDSEIKKANIRVKLQVNKGVSFKRT